MPPKRQRPNSLSSNHDDEKRLCDADPRAPTAPSPSPRYLGSVSVSDSSNDEGQTSTVASEQGLWDLGIVDVDEEDVGDPDKAEGGATADQHGSGVHEPSLTDGASGEPLLGLHYNLVPHTSKINTLLRGAVGECYVKLTDVPDNADWNSQLHLSALDGRALVIVAFGSLSFVHLQFGWMMVPSFSVTVELSRESEKDALQNILDLAENRHEEATRHLRTFRAAHDEHSHFLNMFDCTRCTRANQESRRCGINEFATGDFVRVVMRCMKVVDEDTGRVRVEFKLRRLDLLVPLSREQDIRN
ncbi:hypothetical protein GSI_05293 [Ganoderma sinense ZZ0214-1]|uniref:Uncharacterized protein n=1 Tax=Ganoderma sinense ZZ0214-1 TaxID=1077348 RepID=A0A2G8SFN8_9APHY|nr:hypothetical protein GSI_05293 [Ganoderma sinense ZZ0214-1]